MLWAKYSYTDGSSALTDLVVTFDRDMALISWITAETGHEIN
jgi:hypothetical protein